MTDTISRRDDLGPGSITRAEIASQPELWPVAVGEGVGAEQFQRLLVAGSCLYTGCGSTAHLAEALAYRHRNSLGTAGWAQAASELWLAPPSLHLRTDTVVAISRSGETSETIEACRLAQDRGATVCAITTVGGSALAALADEVIALPFAAEESVVQTRSFSSMLVAGVAAQIEASGDDARGTLASLESAGSRMLDAALSVSVALADSERRTIQEGETSETIEACRLAQDRGATVCAITTVGGSALAALADEVIALPFAAEESVVQTRSFSSMLVAGVAAQIGASGDDARDTLASLEAAGSRMLDAALSVSVALADSERRTIHVLGSGFDLGLAREGALKIKEMSRTNTEACPVLDFRHGPISVVDGAHAALVMCRDGLDRELALAAEVAERGAYVATIGPDARCTIDSTEFALDRDVQSIAGLVVAQVSGLERGLAKGLNPDSPEGVVACVKL